MAFKWTKASRAKLSRSQKALAHSLRAPVQERSSCPNALLPELRPNALLPEFIRSSASLRIRRRSSVWPHCLDSSTQRGRSFGAYCFKLSFTPVAVIANAIAHPDDDEFGPILYTAGPNVTGQFTKDNYGHGVECPAGFQDAAVVGRHGAGDGIVVQSGGLFVMFFG